SPSPSVLSALSVEFPPPPPRPSRYAHRRARDLRQRKIPWAVTEPALLLAMARLCLRDPSLQPLPPIRSLHYFLPVIDEVLAMDISPDYVRYLKRKLAPYLTPDLFPE